VGDSIADLPRLELEERAVSRRRRQLHERIDFIRGSGASDPDSMERLAKLEAEEKDVSARRRELHRRIDTIRADAAAAGVATAPPAEKRERLLDTSDSSYARSLQVGFGSLVKRDDDEE
jgi:hypothetical protein